MSDSKKAVALFLVLCYNVIDKIVPIAGLEVKNRNMAYRRDVDVDYIVNEYLAGKSVKALAEELHIARHAIALRLKNRGITPRNRSESMFNRMAQTSPEERQRLASAAHEAKRGYVNSPETRHKMALCKNKRSGMFELEFITHLAAAGVPVVHQEPFLAYNLDIGCGPVAVEIHTQTSSPLAERFIKKLMECIKAGKHMVYVWINPQRVTVTDSCYENVVALVQSIRANPPAKGKYWVVRGTGELYASGSFDDE
jgi:hypothetical protein